MKHLIRKHFILIIIFSQTALFAKGSRSDPHTPEPKPALPVVPAPAPLSPEEARNYREVIRATTDMVNDSTVHHLAGEWGLDLLNVTWEDTGRYNNSTVGPNISDMTIQVQWEDPETKVRELYLMPVIRFPNFSDKSADLPIKNFSVKTGNHANKPLTVTPLANLLAEPWDFLSYPDEAIGKLKKLLADRDTHVLVSAQACFLPIPKEGRALFNPVLFNYQSSRGNPAVLTILVTREGTSITVIDNVRDSFEAGFSWGQRLFFNVSGQKASLTGQRLSDYQAAENNVQKGGDNETTKPNEKTEELNMVLLIQVPLKYKKKRMESEIMPEELMSMMNDSSPEKKRANSSDVEAAVIGHGDLEGSFIETDGLKIKRDPDFPIRVTVQFYKATSNGVVSEKDMAEIARQIATVYAQADYVGSLVTAGKRGRPTEYLGEDREPPEWWDDFWARHWMNTGMTRDETIDRLRKIFGSPWRIPATRAELEKEVEEITD